MPTRSHQRTYFFVAPDRYMTALDAATGEVIWRKMKEGIRVRESMGLPQDGSLVYVKTMEGELYSVSTTADSMHLSWRSEAQLGYEIRPTPIVEAYGIVYVPTQSGMVCALDRGVDVFCGSTKYPMVWSITSCPWGSSACRKYHGR